MLRPDGSEGDTNSNPNNNKEEGQCDESGAFASLNPSQTANQQHSSTSPSAAAPGFISKTGAIPASYCRGSMTATDEDAIANGSKIKKRRTHSNVSNSSAARLDDRSSGGYTESSGFLLGQRKFAGHVTGHNASNIANHGRVLPC